MNISLDFDNHFGGDSESMTTTRTKDEIEKLKAAWVADPIWDLETEEGFEAHHDELLAYRQQMEAAWDAADLRELESLANTLGIPGNTNLAKHIRWMTDRITQLETLLAMSTGRTIPPIGM